MTPHFKGLNKQQFLATKSNFALNWETKKLQGMHINDKCVSTKLKMFLN